MTCTFPAHALSRHVKRNRQEFCPHCAARIIEGVDDLALDRFWPAAAHFGPFLDAINFWSQVGIPIWEDGNPLALCWPWPGDVAVTFQGRRYSPQGLAYRLAWGSPGPLPISVVCANDECVNPFHLRVPDLRQPSTAILWADQELRVRAMRSLDRLNERINAELGGSMNACAAGVNLS